jgi:chemotaxis protein MotB
MSRFRFLGALGALLLAGGCVSSNQYDEVKYKLQEEEAKSRRLAEENAKLAAALRSKNVDVDKLLAELRELETSPTRGGGRRFNNVTGEEVTRLEKGGLRLGGVNFRSGSAELSDKGKAVLKQVAAELKAKPGFLLVVDGHTDNDPIHKSANASNWELSGKRAAAVVDFLVKEEGVCKGEEALLRGYGEFKPIPGAAKAQNRRVEVYAFDAPGLAPGKSSAAPAAPAAAANPDDEVPEPAPAPAPTRPAKPAAKAPDSNDPTLK